MKKIELSYDDLIDLLKTSFPNYQLETYEEELDFWLKIREISLEK